MEYAVYLSGPTGFLEVIVKTDREISDVNFSGSTLRIGQAVFNVSNVFGIVPLKSLVKRTTLAVPKP